MDLSIILVFAGVFLFSVIWLSKRKRLPPGRFTIPYIGTPGMFREMSGKREHEVFLAETKHYGNIFKFSVGKQLLVVLNEHDLIHEAFVKNAEFCSGRMKGLKRMLNMSPGEDGFLFNDYGPTWRELRRFTIHALRDFGVGKTNIEEKIHAELNSLTTVLNASKGKPVAFIRQIQRLVGNVIFGVIFGKGYDFDDPYFDHLINMTDDFMKKNGLLDVSLFVPEFVFTTTKALLPQIKEKEGPMNLMRKAIYQQIDEHEKTFDNDNIRDFVDIYWRCVKHGDESEKKYVTKENMFRIINDLFLAGSETTSTTLDWAILFISEYPDVQKKCQEEIQAVFGDKTLQYADRDQLHYTNATILEVQRHANIAPLSVPHATSKDIVVGGYTIPANSIVVANLYATSMDPKTFPNPRKFDPERFLDASGKLTKTDRIMPFSVGPRVCAGEMLAKMELFVVFTNLLQRFTFLPASKTKHSFESQVGRMSSTALPFEIRAQIRA